MTKKLHVNVTRSKEKFFLLEVRLSVAVGLPVTSHPLAPAHVSFATKLDVDACTTSFGFVFYTAF